MIYLYLSYAAVYPRGWKTLQIDNIVIPVQTGIQDSKGF